VGAEGGERGEGDAQAAVGVAVRRAAATCWMDGCVCGGVGGFLIETSAAVSWVGCMLVCGRPSGAVSAQPRE